MKRRKIHNNDYISLYVLYFFSLPSPLLFLSLPFPPTPPFSNGNSSAIHIYIITPNEYISEHGVFFWLFDDSGATNLSREREKERRKRKAEK
jgi:hypothetical protein